MRGTLSGGVGVVFPAKAEVEREAMRDAPVVLRIEAGVVVGDERNGHGGDRRGAVDAHGHGNVEIVDHTVAVKILESKI